jgi:hypothetical protein
VATAAALADRDAPGGYDGFGNANVPVRMAAHRHRRLTVS